MRDSTFTPFEEQIRRTASAFPYPVTPDIASVVARRVEIIGRRGVIVRWKRLGYALAIVLVLLSIGLAVPPVRAQILEFLQVGAVRIFLVEPTPSPTLPPPTPSSSAPPETTQIGLLPTFHPTATWTPALPSPTPFSSVLDLFGETTLDKAREKFSYPIRLPAYPENLGKPDKVFLQDTGGESLILVWLEPKNRSKVRLSLQMIAGTQNITLAKIQPQVVQETLVNGEPAVWAEGPYLLKTRNGNYESIRLIQGHVLIWKEGEVTYRLETALALEEAIRIAESLQ